MKRYTMQTTVKESMSDQVEFLKRLEQGKFAGIILKFSSPKRHNTLNMHKLNNGKLKCKEKLTKLKAGTDKPQTSFKNSTYLSD